MPGPGGGRARRLEQQRTPQPCPGGVHPLWRAPCSPRVTRDPHLLPRRRSHGHGANSQTPRMPVLGAGPAPMESGGSCTFSFFLLSRCPETAPALELQRGAWGRVKLGSRGHQDSPAKGRGGRRPAHIQLGGPGAPHGAGEAASSADADAGRSPETWPAPGRSVPGSEQGHSACAAGMPFGRGGWVGGCPRRCRGSAASTVQTRQHDTVSTIRVVAHALCGELPPI